MEKLHNSRREGRMKEGKKKDMEINEKSRSKVRTTGVGSRSQAEEGKAKEALRGKDEFVFVEQNKHVRPKSSDSEFTVCWV